MPFGNPILAGNVLARTAMQSEDFVAGVSGWAIYRDGSAEFNDVVVRGDLLAQAPNGAYVHVYNDATSGRIDLRPPDSAGGTIVPATITSSTTNPKSGNPALGITGPIIDGVGGGAMYLAAGGFFGSELFIDSGYFWLTADGGASWVVNGDWEIAHEIPGPAFLIHFQVWADGTTICGDLDADGGSFSSAVSMNGDLDVLGTLDAAIWDVGYHEMAAAGQNFTNTIVLANVTGMSFLAAANAKYLIQCRYAIGGPIAADVRLAWTVPAGASMARNIVAAGATLAGSNEAATIAILRRGAATQQQGGTSGGTAPGNDFTGWWEDTILTVGATAGTVQLQGAQGTANAVPTVFQGGSYFTVTRIA